MVTVTKKYCDKCGVELNVENCYDFNPMMLPVKSPPESKLLFSSYSKPFDFCKKCAYLFAMDYK